MTTDLKSCISLTVEGGRLCRSEAAAAMGIIMDGRATPAQVGAFLATLRLRGERTEELLGFLDAFRERARTIRIDDPDAIDLCGTGGDGAGTVNVSTIAALVVAGAGVTVAKHGNRAVSSRAGSADLLRELGVGIEAPPETMEACINEIGMGFLFAPVYHPAMRFASGPRSELGIRTCFNILGPLANPACVRRQVVGAFDALAAETIASLFGAMAPASAFVVHSEDGLDEVSPASPTRVTRVGPLGVEAPVTISPESFGVRRRSPLSAVAGSDPAGNARAALSVLSGEPGPVRDFVLMNAALGYCAARDGTPLDEAFAACAESIDSGRALSILGRLVERTAG